MLPGTAAVLAATIKWLMTEFPLNMDSKLLPGLGTTFRFSLPCIISSNISKIPYESMRPSGDFLIGKSAIFWEGHGSANPGTKGYDRDPHSAKG